MRNQSEPPNLAAIKTPISKEGLDQLFREARTHAAWLPEPVPVELLRKAYELARLGPTSANGSPARFVFLITPGAKVLLKPVLAPGRRSVPPIGEASSILSPRHRPGPSCV